MKQILFLLFFAFSFFIFSQKNDYSNCAGQVLVGVNINYKMKFLGHKGEDKTHLYGYLPSERISKNAIWLCYEPQSNGILKVNCQTDLDSLHFAVFKTKTTGSCQEIKEKKAESIFIKTNTNCTEFENAQVELIGGYSYAFVFLAKERINDNIDFQFEFTPKAESGKDLIDSLSLNLVYSIEKPIYSVHILDAITKNPIKSRIVITNAIEIEGTYTASDLFLNLTRYVKQASIKIDAEGYLSKDIFKKITPSKHTSDTILMTRLKRGSVAKLDEMYFAAGLALILEESIPKLKRLRDFLALNPEVNIEIQGHVNDETKRGIFSRRLSKRRAKKILKYLVECGIDETRLTAVGFGNTRPVYKNPSNDEEKEANRRVEILIK